MLSKPNFKAEQLINIQYEFITAVKDIKKNSAASADNRANKEFLEKILAAFNPKDVTKLTPEQISATIANVVKSSGNIDENMQRKTTRGDTPFAFCLPLFFWDCIFTKSFSRAVNSKRYNTLDFHGKSCATKPTVSLDSSLNNEYPNRKKRRGYF